METLGSTSIPHSLPVIEQQPQKHRGLLSSGRDTGVPPLIAWTDNTHYTQVAGFSARRCRA